MIGFIMWDILHYIVNQAENAQKKAGTNFIIKEIIIVLNLVLGPFMGSAFYFTIKQSHQDYIDSTTWSCPLLAVF